MKESPFSRAHKAQESERDLKLHREENHRQRGIMYEGLGRSCKRQQRIEALRLHWLTANTSLGDKR